MYKKLLLIAVLITALSPLAAIAKDSDSDFAGGKRYLVKQCRQFHQGLRRLGLSEVQKPLVAAALESYRDDISVRSEDIHAARRDLFLILHTPVDGAYEEQPVRDSFDILHDLREENIVRHGQLLWELQQIMTDEQYRKFVRAKLFFLRCVGAPRAIFQRYLNAYINRVKNSTDRPARDIN